ncbi:hypothetical protein Rsub_11863 [Raphidocelis subcapitata]|uniref:Uncharacterized protein n=1 Tax=Raphidocelis subcapitata TaxID=307507 RepID=A0A2V0PKK3_9CHLO|nr:hypothetical protein Rsub_11863 [Raphidocelis subcapitata]|eukprot:GBF98533.1 hypothetical protein Rsub_11863 [Raphidocelis subcapitata]
MRQVHHESQDLALQVRAASSGARTDAGVRVLRPRQTAAFVPAAESSPYTAAQGRRVPHGNADSLQLSFSSFTDFGSLGSEAGTGAGAGAGMGAGSGGISPKTGPLRQPMPTLYCLPGSADTGLLRRLQLGPAPSPKLRGGTGGGGGGRLSPTKADETRRQRNSAAAAAASTAPRQPGLQVAADPPSGLRSSRWRGAPLAAGEAARATTARRRAAAAASGGRRLDLAVLSSQKPLLTGDDAVRHFVSGAGRPGEAVFCNPAAAAGDGWGGPSFDLVVVPQSDANPDLHYVVGYSGVVELRRGAAPELTPLAEWVRLGRLHRALAALPFSRHNALSGAFARWHRGAMHQVMACAARTLSGALLTGDSSVRACIAAAREAIARAEAEALSPTELVTRRAASHDAAGTRLAALHAELLRFLEALAADLEQRIRSAHSAAAADNAAAAERSPRLPWQVPGAFRIAAARQHAAALLCRVVDLLDAMLSSALAQAATAAVAAVEAAVAGSPPALHLRVCIRPAAAVPAGTGLIFDGGLQAVVPQPCVSFSVTRDECEAALAQLPLAVVAAASAAPRLADSAAARSWQVNAAAGAVGGQGARPPPTQQPAQIGQQGIDPPSRRRSARLEVLEFCSRANACQDALARFARGSWDAAVGGPVLQPFVRGAAVRALAAEFDAEGYGAAASSAVDVCADLSAARAWRDCLSSCPPLVVAGPLLFDVGEAQKALLPLSARLVSGLEAVLLPSFLRLCALARGRLDAAAAALRQRPEGLDDFIAWEAAQQGHMPSLGGARDGRGGRAGELRQRLTAECDALRRADEVLRGGSVGSTAGGAGTDGGSAAAAARLRLLGLKTQRPTAGAGSRPASARELGSAARALEGVQEALHNYKDAGAAADKYAAAAVRVHAPEMSARLVAAELKLFTLLAAIRRGGPTDASQEPGAALQTLAALEAEVAQAAGPSCAALDAAGAFSSSSSVARAAHGVRTTLDALRLAAADLRALWAALGRWRAAQTDLRSTRATDARACRAALMRAREAEGQLSSAVQGWRGRLVAEDLRSGTCATPEEAALAASGDMERRAWHGQLPAAQALWDGELQPRHTAMLAALLLDLRGGPPAALASVGGSAADDECGLPLGELMHRYALVTRGKQDGEASPLGAATTNATTEGASGSSGGSGGEQGHACPVSAAELVAVCSRGARSKTVLAHVLGLARAEAALASDLRGLQARLMGLPLTLSAERVAGCLLLLNLPQLAAELEGSAAAALRHAHASPAAPGVAQLARVVQGLQQHLIACVRVSGG